MRRGNISNAAAVRHSSIRFRNRCRQISTGRRMNHRRAARRDEALSQRKPSFLPLNRASFEISLAGDLVVLAPFFRAEIVGGDRVPRTHKA